MIATRSVGEVSDEKYIYGAFLEQYCSEFERIHFCLPGHLVQVLCINPARFMGSGFLNRPELIIHVLRDDAYPGGAELLSNGELDSIMKRFPPTFNYNERTVPVKFGSYVCYSNVK